MASPAWFEHATYRFVGDCSSESELRREFCWRVVQVSILRALAGSCFRGRRFCQFSQPPIVVVAPGEEFESPTFGFGNRCAGQLRQPGKTGTCCTNRTCDPRLIKTMLWPTELNRQNMAGSTGFEPVCPCGLLLSKQAPLTSRPTSLHSGGRRLDLTRNRLPGSSAFKTAPDTCRVHLPMLLALRLAVHFPAEPLPFASQASGSDTTALGRQLTGGARSPFRGYATNTG